MPWNEDYCNNIRSGLAQLVYEVSIDKASNLQSISIHAENFAREFLNELFGWNLVSLNYPDPFAAGVDLIDHENKIVVQISSTYEKSKIQDSLKKSERYANYHFYFFAIALEQKQKKASSSFNNFGLVFDPEKDIITMGQLSSMIANTCNIDKQKELSIIIDKYFFPNKKESKHRLKDMLRRLWSSLKKRRFLATIVFAVLVIVILVIIIITATSSTSLEVPVQLIENENGTITQYRYLAWAGDFGTWCCKWDTATHREYTLISTEWSTIRYEPKTNSDGRAIKLLCGYGYSENHPHQFFSGTLSGSYGYNGKFRDFWYMYDINGITYYWEETREVSLSELSGGDNKVATNKTGDIGDIKYYATVYYRNRTDNSVQLKVTWTSTMDITKSSVYSQHFVASIGSISTDPVQIVEYNGWNWTYNPNNDEDDEKYQEVKTHFAQVSSPWITVPVNTTTSTNVYLHIYFYQADKDGRDLSNMSGIACLDQMWEIALPDLHWN